MKTKLSIIICTYNGENLIKNCLNSILTQTFKDFEVLCMDGMSQDNTIPIIKDYMKKDQRVKLITNKNRLPEGYGNGKWLGFKKSNGEIIGFIDQDNILQKKDLFAKVINTFSKEKNAIGILGGLTYDKNDSRVVRYVSLVGTDSFFAYRSLDFIRNILPLSKEEDEYYDIQLDNMYLTGGNCFFYKKDSLVNAGGFDQDVLTIQRIIKRLEKKKIIVISASTKHYAEKNLFLLIKKKFHWGSKYYESTDIEKFNYLPKTKLELKNFYKNVIFNLTVLPNFFYATRLYRKSKDAISFLFPFIAFANTVAYAFNFLKSKQKILD